MATFRTQLTDIKNYIAEVWLDGISDEQIIKEINGEYSYTFTIPLDHIYYPYLTERKYIRLHDIDKDFISTTISTGTGTKTVVVASNSGFKIGDYVLINETTENNWAAELNGSVTAGAAKTVTFQNDVGTLFPASGNRFVKIWDDRDAEKTVATNVFRRQPNSEPLEGSSFNATTFVADLAYDYNDGAYVFQPGRSIATKITNINGTTISLSRKDFTVQVSSRFEKINYTTFRIVEITEHRSDSKPFATVRCNHLTYDLNDTIYFKNSRLMFAAGTNTLATAFIDLIDIDTFMDNILGRQVDGSGDPIKTTSFFKGDLLRFIHSKGQVTTDGTAVVVVTAEAGELELKSIHIASSSTMSIKGESGIFTVASQDTANFDSITLTSAASNTATVDYQIISKGIYTGDDFIGTCTVTNDSKVISSVNITVTGGTISHGAVFEVEGDDKSYLVDYIATTGADLVLTEAIERANGSTLNFILKTDRRELKINAGIKLLGALRRMVEVFSDDRQHINFRVNPDRSIDVIQTPIPDDRDPTSDLVVRYQDQMVKNLTSIERLFDITDFGNRIIPQGASSGWINTFSGVSSSVLGNPVGLQKSGVSNVAYLQDDAGRNFKTLGVIPGMVVTNSTKVETGTVSSIQDEAATNDRLNIVGGLSGGGDWDSGNSFVIDLGNTRNQCKITTGDLKKFRFGDPVRIFQDKFTFTETESTQITVSKGLSGDATSGSTTTMVDSTPVINFVTEGVTVGMLITNNKFGKNSAYGRITSISTTTNTNDTINFSAALKGGTGSEDFDALDTYSITLVEQYSFLDDGGVFTDESADADNGISFNLLPTTPATNDAFYFGASEVFGYITIAFQSISGEDIDNVWEYYDGTQWSTLTFEIQEITDFIQDGTQQFTNTFRIPTDWTATTVNSQSAFWVRFRVTALNSGGATPTANRIFNREWQENKYSGGLVLVTSGEGKGQIRRVVSNTQNTLTVSRKWDLMPTGATVIVARRIAKTFIRGFGYRQFTADRAGANFVTAFGLPTVDHSYRGGLLVVKSGPGQSQFKTIEINRTQDGGSGSAEDTAWTVNTQFNPIPEGAIIEVTALPQMVEEFRLDTAFSASQVDVITVLDYPASTDDIWDGGQVVVTSGTQEGNTKTITISPDQGANILRITTAGWGSAPTDADGVILTKETDLHLSFADAIDFVPDDGDEVVLLMKESSVPLTVGKYATRRSTAVTATQTTIDVQSGDGSNFSVNDIIYVGALQLNRVTSLTIGRGDQVIGKEYTIVSISTDELTLNESMDPTPQPGDHIEVIGFVDATSIIKNDISEVVFERSDLNDPKRLFDEANRYLQDITSIEPRYKVQFIDLYEVDRSEFAFDNYEVGDSIRIIDDRVTGNEGANLRVLRESFSPNLPPDKTNSLELGKQPLRQADDYITSLYQKQIEINRKVDLLRYEKAVPRCMWWDDGSKLCAKPDWPNVFCNSVDSGFNGRTSRDGSQIKKIDCQAYEPPDANRVGSETARVEGQLLTVSSVSNAAYDNTSRVAIDVPFKLSDSSYCFIIEVSDDASITSQIDPTAVSCRIQVDTAGDIVPYVVVGEELGTGGYIQVKRDSGSTTYTVTIQVHATGCDI